MTIVIAIPVAILAQIKVALAMADGVESMDEVGIALLQEALNKRKTALRSEVLAAKAPLPRLRLTGKTKPPPPTAMKRVRQRNRGDRSGEESRRKAGGTAPRTREANGWIRQRTSGAAKEKQKEEEEDAEEKPKEKPE